MISLAIGLPGTGKTTLLHDLVAAQCHVQRFFVVDHDGSWGPSGIHWRGRPPYITTIRKGRGREDLPQELPDAGVFVFDAWDGRDVADLVIHFGWTTYVDDEIDKAGRHEGFGGTALRTIANEGRHARNVRGEATQVHLYGACRRLQRVHTDLSELADELFIFRTKGKNTLKRLLDEDHVTEDELPFITRLPTFHYKHVGFGGKEAWLQIAPLGGSPKKGNPQAG